MIFRSACLAAVTAGLLFSSAVLAQKVPNAERPQLSGNGQSLNVPDGTPTANFSLSIAGQVSPGVGCTGPIASQPFVTMNLGAGATITGIGWNTLLETVGTSWASEATMVFGTRNARQLINLVVGAGVDQPTPAGGTKFAAGPVDLSGVGLPNIVLEGDGLLYVTFCEVFVNNTGLVDANWRAPSLINVDCFNCAPNIGVSPTTLAFGLAAVGSTTGAQPFTVTNDGMAPGNVTGLAIIGPYAIAAGGTCATVFPFALAANASCTFHLAFSPTAAGSTPGTATVGLNPAVGTGPTVVNLSGTGTVAVFGFSTSSINFGAVSTGSISSATFVTITNSGGAVGSVDAFSFVGPFARSGGTCGSPSFSLAAGASCTVGVVFNAGLIGPATGSFSITAGGNANVIGLSGLSVLPAPAFIPSNNVWTLALMALLMSLLAGVAGFRRQS